MNKSLHYKDTKKKKAIQETLCAECPNPGDAGTPLRENKQSDDLLHIYHVLLSHFGPLHWWPADSPFEVMVGAILTQNTGNCYHFRIIAPMSFKVKAVATRCGISADKAQDMVSRPAWR